LDFNSKVRVLLKGSRSSASNCPETTVNVIEARGLERRNAGLVEPTPEVMRLM